MENQMGGTDGQGELVPFVISQNVWEHLRVRTVAARAVMQSDLIPMAAAFQFQVPARTWRREGHVGHVETKHRPVKQVSSAPEAGSTCTFAASYN